MADQTAYNDISHRYPLIAPNGDNMNNLLKKQKDKNQYKRFNIINPIKNKDKDQ